MRRRNYLLSGVSRGLGYRIAERLLAAGHGVYGFSRTRSDSVAELLEQKPEQFFFAEIDLEKVDELEERVFREFLPSGTIIDGLVNNAALAYDDLATNMDLVALESMFRVNVTAPMALTRGCIRNFILHNTPGSLVHLSSVCVYTGFKGLSFYASTKGALEAYSKNVAREWGSKGIRSNSVAAGFMETDMTGVLDAETKDRIFRRTAIKGPVDPDQVAQTVGFLLSDDSKAITGETIRVDNGSL